MIRGKPLLIKERVVRIEAAVGLNSSERLTGIFIAGRIPTRRVWMMLALRSAVAFGLLLSIAGAMALAGGRNVFAASAIALVGAAILARVPGDLLARALWGGSNITNAMLIQRLPPFAVYPLFALMPLTQALAELPLYFGYVVPRLRAQSMDGHSADRRCAVGSTHVPLVPARLTL